MLFGQNATNIAMKTKELILFSSFVFIAMFNVLKDIHSL